MDQQAFENAIRKAAERTASSATIVVDFNNYNGWCIQTDASDTVYLVMMGEKRRIPNEDIFKGLFASCKIQNGTSLVGSLWTQLVDEMPSGGDITDGAQLIKSTDSDAVFLLTNGKKYGITSSEQFEGCNFSWKKIHVYPPIIINAIPDGGNDAFLRT